MSIKLRKRKKIFTFVGKHVSTGPHFRIVGLQRRPKHTQNIISGKAKLTLVENAQNKQEDSFSAPELRIST